MTIAKTETAALESSGILQLNGINADNAESLTTAADNRNNNYYHSYLCPAISKRR